MNDLLEEITVFHKEDNIYKRYNLVGSVRVDNLLKIDKNNKEVSNGGLVRIFDIEEYKTNWFVSLGDIVVIGNVDDEIEKAPKTTLRNKYGNKVFEINSINEFIFDDEDTKDLQHVKIGLI